MQPYIVFHVPLYILECTRKMISVHKSFLKFIVAIQLVYSFFKVLQCPSVKMEMFVLLEVMTYQVEWKFAIITHGELYVMTCGMSGMLEWCADNLDYHQHVSITNT